ncbi:RNA-directed DNA polymerase [Arcticibacter tournemirensis]|uniref:RNA-directed DNA polymerase n=1 Tax=Arcticibacter tournemirensis TaxID=699437 RepID=A0A5M9GN00_9SPHI|nr:reverse transcriptase family protein [Arcticibacter tournemirensis]KAA8474174.1 RNA-directed DNA polymerase [Arcticibacter tournemirensis]TQM49631.1 RNA-directed DNA polymerase [Arcticibacter tournemirensis]
MLDTPKLLRILGISSKELEGLLKGIDEFYYLKSSPKLNKKTGLPLIAKNGKPRTRDLYPSIKLLKTVQQRIYHRFLKSIKLPAYAFGGISKRDNVLNAKMHQGNKFFFNTDLRNFYPGITHQQVFDMFVRNKIPLEAASILTKLTTYKGMLPQGTPTSPYLANLVFVSVGKKIQILADEHGLTFTTFVDDIAVSGKNDFKPLVNTIIDLLINNGFKISHDKTFYQTKRPKVTNVIVANNGIYLDSSYKEKILTFEDPLSAAARGTLNYYDRVKKISRTKKSRFKSKLGF